MSGCSKHREHTSNSTITTETSNNNPRIHECNSQQIDTRSSSNIYTERVLSVTADLERPTRHVSFALSTIDNENLNKKKSKICCIHHSKDVPLDRIPKDFPNAYER